jgi:hypothetical protein
MPDLHIPAIGRLATQWARCVDSVETIAKEHMVRIEESPIRNADSILANPHRIEFPSNPSSEYPQNPHPLPQKLNSSMGLPDLENEYSPGGKEKPIALSSLDSQKSSEIDWYQALRIFCRLKV